MTARPIYRRFALDAQGNRYVELYEFPAADGARFATVERFEPTGQPGARYWLTADYAVTDADGAALGSFGWHDVGWWAAGVRQPSMTAAAFAVGGE